MAKFRIFISSVQSEFASERRRLCDYIRQDALLGRLFVPFLFEDLPAEDQNAREAYLSEAARSEVYVGLFGERYGFEDEEGVSPTEREFDAATQHTRYRLVFIKQVAERHPKEQNLIDKAEQAVVRKAFNSYEQLQMAVYAALVRFLEVKEIVRISPFDASINTNASLSDIDERKVQSFINMAKLKRDYKLTLEKDGLLAVLMSLDLATDDGRVTNSALLLFGKNPQHFFRPSEVKCAQFYGVKVQKPAPYYQVFGGTIFEMCDQAVSFVMSHIDARIGNHSEEDDGVEYEIPVAAVHEAIINAIVHRDYTSNASVQVMLFRDRLEIWNPGRLPIGLTTEKLKVKHKSIPVNPILAYPTYLAGYIERLGTGTNDLVETCVAKGLKAPEFIEDEDFCTIIWRNNMEVDTAEKNPPENPADKETTEKDIENPTENPTEKKSLTPLEAKIVGTLKKNPTYSQKQIADEIGVGFTTVREYIGKLKKKGLLTRVGPDKGGYWQVTEKKE